MLTERVEKGTVSTPTEEDLFWHLCIRILDLWEIKKKEQCCSLPSKCHVAAAMVAASTSFGYSSVNQLDGGNRGMMWRQLSSCSSCSGSSNCGRNGVGSSGQQHQQQQLRERSCTRCQSFHRHHHRQRRRSSSNQFRGSFSTTASANSSCSPMALTTKAIVSIPVAKSNGKSVCANVPLAKHCTFAAIATAIPPPPISSTSGGGGGGGGSGSGSHVSFMATNRYRPRLQQQQQQQQQLPKTRLASSSCLTLTATTPPPLCEVPNVKTSRSHQSLELRESLPSQISTESSEDSSIMAVIGVN